MEDNFERFGGLKALTSQYEQSRRQTEGYFASEPEPVDKRNWQVLHFEGPEVFRYKSSSQYWQHRKDSVVNPKSTRFINRKCTKVKGGKHINESTIDIAANKPDTPPASTPGQETPNKSMPEVQFDG